jgi:hypothetical protein
VGEFRELHRTLGIGPHKKKENGEGEKERVLHFSKGFTQFEFKYKFEFKNQINAPACIK